eukprot:355203-Chlamydomonas_euryale.AAC.4
MILVGICCRQGASNQWYLRATCAAQVRLTSEPGLKSHRRRTAVPPRDARHAPTPAQPMAQEADLTGSSSFRRHTKKGCGHGHVGQL